MDREIAYEMQGHVENLQQGKFLREKWQKKKNNGVYESCCLFCFCDVLK